MKFLHVTASMNMWLHLLPTRKRVRIRTSYTHKSRVHRRCIGWSQHIISSYVHYYTLLCAWVRTHAPCAMPSTSLLPIKRPIWWPLVVLKVKYLLNYFWLLLNCITPMPHVNLKELYMSRHLWMCDCVSSQHAKAYARTRASYTHKE